VVITIYSYYIRNVKSQGKYHLDIEIDMLTNSIQNTISGDSFPTEILPFEKADLKNVSKLKGWLFSWNEEFKLKDRNIYKLTIKDNSTIIQGLISLSDYNDHYFVHIIESAPFNLGKRKLYEGVAGNLFAFACKISWDRKYQGFISFTSKTKLIEHYEKTLDAVHIGGNKMVIFPKEALKLILKYFPNKTI
jgi:hypothetical protein